MNGPLTIRQPAARQLYRVFHTGVYLILHTPITRPTTGHIQLLPSDILFEKIFIDRQRIRQDQVESLQCCFDFDGCRRICQARMPWIVG
jgi:hypothetical protein